ncbi:hypothetical protein [Sphingopyxis terrae]|uniref:hypothetical protein n=1 Tax=Sphingopyxis terrae TaxID=33052 RepID=UPI00363931AC
MSAPLYNRDILALAVANADYPPLPRRAIISRRARRYAAARSFSTSTLTSADG